MRGKGPSQVDVHRGCGITPAYAGKRNFWRLRCGSMWDHPRVCGEKFQLFIELCFVLGSPPRMRGKGTSAVVMRRQLGITPAYAGKSRTRRCWTKTTAGSPPRMRGKGFGVVRRNGRPRITPAYAGKRQRPRRFPQGDRDHPRVCGEKRNGLTQIFRQWGSPPRMRGKGGQRVPININQGITPAYAGKRRNRQLQRRNTQDHPRVCGEKFVTHSHNHIHSGITPAYAGKRITGE